MPPPNRARFPETVQFVRVSVPLLLMPPPVFFKPPPEIVRPEMATTLPLVIAKMPNGEVSSAGSGRTVTPASPGTWMSMMWMLLERSGSALRSKRLPLSPAATAIVSSPDWELAWVMAARSEPRPLSSRFVTTISRGQRRPSSNSSAACTNKTVQACGRCRDGTTGGKDSSGVTSDTSQVKKDTRDDKTKESDSARRGPDTSPRGSRRCWLRTPAAVA